MVVKPVVNAKRVYRVARERQLLLMASEVPLPGYSQDHNGRVGVDRSDTRWCSDGLEFKCLNDDAVLMAFLMGYCDREAISFVAKRGKGLSAWMAQKQVVLAVCKRFEALDCVSQPRVVD